MTDINVDPPTEDEEFPAVIEAEEVFEPDSVEDEGPAPIVGSPDDTAELSVFVAPIPERLMLSGQTISEIVGINGMDLAALGGDLTLEEFQQIGNFVQISAAGSPWWEGDWGNYGEVKFGPDYLQAINIDWSDSSVHADRRVTAGAFPFEKRVKELTFEHHKIVVKKVKKAADLHNERAAWLKAAVDEGWTPAQLAKAIRDASSIEVDEIEDEARPGPLTYASFTITFTVPVQDADQAEIVMERMETVTRQELESAGVQVQSASSKRRG